MKKKIITIIWIGIMGLCILCGCTAASEIANTESETAAEADITVSDNSGNKTLDLTQEGASTITEGGSYAIRGTLQDGQFVVDTSEAVTLELNNVSITNSKGAAIYCKGGEVTVVLKENTVNTLTDGGNTDSNAALYCESNLTIEGEGQLEVTGNQAHGIKSEENLNINGGNITAAAVKDAIHGKNNVTINDGTITVSNANEGIESKGDVIINGGSVYLVCSDDGINGATDITINGGTIYAQSTKGDAIDSNGSIHLNGGTVVAAGSPMPEGGIDCDGNEILITGGILVATGGTNSTPTENGSTQSSIMLAGVSANTLLHIEGEDGTVLTFEAPEAYAGMVFSSPDLAVGKSYTIYEGGTVTGSSNLNGLHSGGTYADGTKGETITLDNMVTINGGSTGMGGGQMGGGKMNRGEERPAIPEGKLPEEAMPEGKLPEGTM